MFSSFSNSRDILCNISGEMLSKALLPLLFIPVRNIDKCWCVSCKKFDGARKSFIEFFFFSKVGIMLIWKLLWHECWFYSVFSAQRLCLNLSAYSALNSFFFSKNEIRIRFTLRAIFGSKFQNFWLWSFCMLNSFCS